MKLGCCVGIDQIGDAQNAGYDFIECTVVSLAHEVSEAEFLELKKKVQESPIRVEVCNVFLPSDIKIVGEEVDIDRVKEYLERSISRVQQIGADTIVFGSGGARSYPNSFSYEKAEQQVLQFLDMAADIADPLGMTIVIEPLNTKESNMINSVLEALDFAKKVDRKSIRVLADFYHMDEENEPLDNIALAQEYLSHVHVADTGRYAPGTGSYPYKEFSKRLKRAGYEGRISIECSWNDFTEEAAKAREFLEQYF